MPSVEAGTPLVQQVVAAIAARSGRHVRDLQVEVHEQGLILRGRSLSYYAKQMAQHAAMTASGLRIWSNRIVVE